MILITTTEDSVRIYEHQEFAQEVLDAVESCMDQNLQYGILVSDEDDVGIYGYRADQILAMCEAEGISDQELLSQFLCEKMGIEKDRIEIVALSIEGGVTK